MFDLDHRLKDLRASLVVGVFVGATAVLGMVWISLGLYSYLNRELGPVWGPLVLGMICFVPLIWFALAKTFTRPAPTPPASMPLEANLVASLLENKVFDGARGTSPLIIALVAVAAGFIASRFPGALATFSQVLAAYSQGVKRSPGPDEQSQG